MPIRQRVLRMVLLIPLPFLMRGVVLAQSGNPGLFFTDNIAATAPSQAVSAMEQALLDRLSSAVNSVDAAIYDFNRGSLRYALVAAHNRGVGVRVVTDVDAYANSSYAPHFAALEAAGIPVVQDQLRHEPGTKNLRARQGHSGFVSA